MNYDQCFYYTCVNYIIICGYTFMCNHREVNNVRLPKLSGSLINELCSRFILNFIALYFYEYDHKYRSNVRLTKLSGRFVNAL